ncbi:branched-chain amino acid ABC transporter permease [Collibacillus ludicampi]|uniref:Branched-chain amino acid ABC transporter permease n=1 Tax=Collibacillus ludicampi TaxID=2771369 RepID=A0AAV4LHA3_9BACL|nr:branched-chain amino acid ABC transporter permease [Collibacillus ludicampi]GIM47074.1 branched-chain amino acid ABC transporter permease [Collibacillus ludicampi]
MMRKTVTTSPLIHQKLLPIQRYALIGFAILLFCFPFVANNYWIDVGTMALFYVVLSLGLNIVVGFAGLLDLGYSAFFAVGAYTTGILTTQYHVSFWVTLLLAGIFAGLAGILIGAPTLRLRSDYLAIVTLGFGEIIRISAKNLQFTGSASGIYGIPRPQIGSYMFTNLTDFYYAMLILAILTLIAVNRLGNSRLGRAWKYIREDEDAAEAMGVNRVRVKLTAYALGAMFGGFAGALFAAKMTAIAPESFNFMQSVMILLAIVIGGLGRLPGVVLGAVIVILLPEAMRDFSNWRFLLFGVLLVIIMIFRPQGLWPARKDVQLEQE